jgi:putative hemolysin
MIMTFFFVALISLIALFFLSAQASALRRLHKRDSNKAFKLIGHLFFYRSFFSSFFPKEEYEGILFSTIVAQNVTRYSALTSWTVWLYLLDFGTLSPLLFIPLVLGMIVLFYATSDYIPRIIGSKYPIRALWVSSIATSPFLFLSFPITFLFIHISQSIWNSLYFDSLNESMGEVKHEIFEILQEADLSTKLTLHDRKLIESVVRFQSLLAREVMVPRIDMFSLNASLSIQEAVKVLQDQGYSRIPVYKETIDHIIGVLMYKDVLTMYIEYQQKGNDLKILKAPIETIVKSVMYTPETKKISNLLQEFRKKQMHLAIVVDEYGGTEGIVTIEDILETIVGDIEDEYDREEDLFIQIGSENWIVDARMSLLDAEEQLGLSIPQEGDYDTIGGYIFHRAGAIPSQGFMIKQDDMELEVLKSNDRRIEKVKIKRIAEGRGI